tara:strand:+ start:1020 stop:1946 length:927 start_codon:yes stop_codon:yes gene_type:complete
MNTHDVLIIGAGPAALSAAIYTTREEIDTVLYEKGIAGGLAATTDWIDNYPGFSKGIDGVQLASEMRAQAERFGAVLQFKEVHTIDRGSDGDITITTTTGDVVRARAVLIATGSEHKKLNIPGEDEYYARGVHYCATCDGAFYKGKRVAVVGGGNSAVQEALFLTRFATHVDLLVRSEIKASEVLQRKLEENDAITVHKGVSPLEMLTEGETLTGITVVRADGTTATIPVDGVFIFIGLLPNTDFLKNSAITLDEQGFVQANERLETSVKGVFVAGDVRSGATMQIASAVGEGATAALRIREYLEGES